LAYDDRANLGETLGGRWNLFRDTLKALFGQLEERYGDLLAG